MDIIEIVSDWNFWEHELETGIERRYSVEGLKKLNFGGSTLAIIGPRRSGKSFTMRQMAKKLIESGVDAKDILIVNFDDYRLDPSLKELDRIIRVYRERIMKGSRAFVFLDEIHKVEGWERFVKTLIDSGRFAVSVSGSTSNLIGERLGSLLTGRHTDLRVFPLNFAEFLRFEKKKVISGVSARRELWNFMETGGFPYVVLSKDYEILYTYFMDILYRDIAERFRVRELNKLVRAAFYLISIISGKVTYNSFAKFLGISTSTADRWFYYLADSYLFFFVSEFRSSFKKIEKSPKKVYCVDLGLARRVGFRISENRGQALENLVFLELVKNLPQDREIYYYSSENYEVDFVIFRKPEVEQLIQVSYSLEDEKTRKRELKALVKASRELGCNNLLLLTWDEEGKEKLQGKEIKLLPVWKWLISRASPHHSSGTKPSSQRK